MEIERKYIINENNQKVAVQLDIGTFEKIEEVLENYALVQWMQQVKEDDELLDMNQAMNYYQSLEKAR